MEINGNSQTVIAKRLSEYIEYDAVTTPSQFAAKAGIDASGFHKMLKGQLKITATTLKKIATAYGLNFEWLLTGEGKMFADKELSPEISSKVVPGVQFVPLLNIDSVGGMHSDNQVTAYEEEYTERMMPFPGARPDDVAVYESGNSMAPYIPAGSILLIRQVQGWEEYFGYGHTYVLVLKNGRRITKRVNKSTEDHHRYVLCESVNPDYPSEELPRSMIHSVWKVVDILIHEGY